MGMGDAAFDPSRFLKAQEPVYATVLRELRSGRKRTHWMWFVFPQLAGLGHSLTARTSASRISTRRGSICAIRCSARGCARARG